VEETIYVERFKHCEQLCRMGANIDVHQGEAVIHGPTPLYGTKVAATDLRCGAAMVVAGLLAEGTTTISNIYHIDRGYDHIDDKLNALGAKVWREKVADDEED
jgi:UDP-N-acetylglucosamine 1-carboxyvinyltransferase